MKKPILRLLTLCCLLALLGSMLTLAVMGSGEAVDTAYTRAAEELEQKYPYSARDLGATCTTGDTTFRLWAPTATAVRVKVYDKATGGRFFWHLCPGTGKGRRRMERHMDDQSDRHLGRPLLYVSRHH